MLAVGRMGFPLAALCNDQLGGELFCGGFAIEALLLFWIGVVRDRLRFDSNRGATRALALRCSSLH